MSDTKSELEEVRAMLQGALADAAILKVRASNLSARLEAAEDRNAELFAEVTKLRQEKQQIWGKLLEDDAPEAR